MALQKLSTDIQSLFCASTQIWSYKRAVEELVYNSLDAGSTSIAIRINIEQNSIQILDNGCGVSKSNFNLLGHRHATSKCIDLSTLKSVPNTYGYRGQALASIVEVSKNVKITSRCQDTGETWEKSFHKGKEQNLSHSSKRPSKGTTVDIAGFLYNLNIQKNGIDSLTELNSIKNFLEQLSLVHNNISVSLRDDTKNEIVFKLHKNRDIYQTLTSLFGIDRKDVQELTIEKNPYKVVAYIGKQDKEICQKHWIYLNGRVLQNSKVHKTVNDYLKRYLKLNLQNTKKVKTKAYNKTEEGNLGKNGIPFYFIFITCPYNSYDITNDAKQTVVEFKNWEQINKLIEKMAKFYSGDISLEKLKPVTNPKKNQNWPENTRDQVKKIVDKILASNSKRIGVSQMQNGIKGKITKRKPKKKVEKITQPKVPADNLMKPSEKEKVNFNFDATLNSQTFSNNDLLTSKYKETKLAETTQKKANNLINSSKGLATRNNNTKPKYKLIIRNKQKTRKVSESSKDNITQDKIANQDKNNIKNHEKQTMKKRKSHGTKNLNQKATVVKHKGKKSKIDCNKSMPTPKHRKIPKKFREDTKNIRKETKQKIKDPLVKIFKDPTQSIKRRCNLLANKVDHMMNYRQKRKRKVFINETIQYSNIVRNNKNYSVRKKIGEIVIHDYIPKPISLSPCTYDDRVWDNQMKKSANHKSSYDLVQTILRTQETENSYINGINAAFKDKNASQESVDDMISAPTNGMISKPKYSKEDDAGTNIPLMPKLTFESHNYTTNWNYFSHKYNERSEYENHNEKSENVRFITTQSMDNFVIPTSKPKRKKIFNSKIKHAEFQSNKIDMFSKKGDSYEERSFTIEFSKSNEKYTLENDDVLQNIDMMSFNILNETKTDTHNGDKTYSIEKSNIEKEINSQNYLTYTINDYSPVDKRHEGYSENKEDKDYIEDTNEWLNKQGDWKSVLIENNIDQSNRNHDEPNMNVVFISKSQDQQLHDYDPHNICETVHSKELKENAISRRKWNDSLFNIDLDQQLSTDFDPHNICKIVHSQEFEEIDIDCRKGNDSLFNGDLDIDSFLCDRNAYTQCDLHDLYNEVNTNFNAEKIHNPVIEKCKMIEGLNEKGQIATNNILHKDVLNKSDQIVDTVDEADVPRYEDVNVVKDIPFSLRNRLRFVPKGMSQIFTKCQSRNVCDYNFDQDYYEEEIYNNFADKVELNCEIFEPAVQNIKEITTKAIEKVQNKVDKDNASLIFNGEALKQAKCYRQVDNKFIAAKIKGRPNQKTEEMEYLVLFDQHAVHERIRLENNLADYIHGTEWKSIPVDNITIKLTKDEILYLHNYNHKFNQLGLQWKFLANGEVSINAIPEAILGKTPRQVEIVMKAVKNLISEEINAIKTQSGCISLYPQAIMDLVFSEACRYAIKFGDPLSKKECEELLSSLSECKVPFQCAHGRPVMAVLLDIKKDIRKYQINLKSLMKWIMKLKTQVKKK